MARLRMQHRRSGKMGASGLLKVFGLFLVLFLLLFLGMYWMKTMPFRPAAWSPADPAQRFFLPEQKSGVEVRHHPNYSLAFLAADSSICWAACEWDARMDTGLTSFFDTNYFQMDTLMYQTWKEWGQKGQSAAQRLGKIFVVAGKIPELDSLPSQEKYYMAWLDEGYAKLEAVGLIFCDSRLRSVPVDSVESLIEIDLFPEYWLDSLENLVEKELNAEHWAPEIPQNLYFVPEKTIDIHGF